jgi:inner membrane protein
MSVLGHIAIGVVTARAVTPPEEDHERLAGRMVGLSLLAILPDSDFILSALAPRVELLEHRGATHSLAVALTVGLVIAFAMSLSGNGDALRWGIIAGAVVASHGLIDTLGQTDLGVALFWPFSDVRVLAPWHVLPNPALYRPLVTNFFGELVIEAVVFIPAWLYAFWPRRRRAEVPAED